MFDYEKDTKAFYQSDEVAGRYHREFAEARGLKGLRFRYVASRERAAVRSLIGRLRVERAVDVPAGTGKMAPVFAEIGCSVLACDVSGNMLNMAKHTYAAAGVEDVAFQVVDLALATESIVDEYDVTVCIRLMHRVPNEVKRRMLSQIARLSPYAIVSFGIDSRYQRVRQAFRRLLLGGRDIGLETRPTRGQVEALLGERFEILGKISVAPGISAERIYLIKAR